MIEAEVAELLESPCSLIVGTVDTDGLPDATRGRGLEVLQGGTRIRLLLAENAAASLGNLATTGRIALTATHFSTLVSVQLKGRSLSVEPATVDDRLRFDRFCAGCVQTIAEIDGAPEETVWRFEPPGIVACTVEVEELYDQTPGPAAGALVAPVAP